MSTYTATTRWNRSGEGDFAGGQGTGTTHGQGDLKPSQQRASPLLAAHLPGAGGIARAAQKQMEECRS